MFDQAAVRQIRSQIQEIVDPLAKSLGMSIKVGNGSFNSQNINFKLEIAVISNGLVMNREASDFSVLAGLYGFKKTDLGREFQYGGETFVLTGLAPRRSKFPVLADRKRDNKKYKFPADVIKIILKEGEEQR